MGWYLCNRANPCPDRYLIFITSTTCGHTAWHCRPLIAFIEYLLNIYLSLFHRLIFLSMNKIILSCYCCCGSRCDHLIRYSQSLQPNWETERGRGREIPRYMCQQHQLYSKKPLTDKFALIWTQSAYCMVGFLPPLCTLRWVLVVLLLNNPRSGPLVVLSYT